MTEKTILFLEEISRRICEKYKLENVYFTQIIGKRRHHLAGCGKEVVLPAEQMELSGNISVFWQGNLTGDLANLLREELAPVAERLEKELA